MARMARAAAGRIRCLPFRGPSEESTFDPPHFTRPKYSRFQSTCFPSRNLFQFTGFSNCNLGVRRAGALPPRKPWHLLRYVIKLPSPISLLLSCWASARPFLHFDEYFVSFIGAFNAKAFCISLCFEISAKAISASFFNAHKPSRMSESSC